MSQYGPKWPLKKGNEDLYEMYDEIKDQISFFLKNLLLTSHGENLSNPSYGVGLRSFIFEQNIDSTYGRLSSIISDQVEQYIPYINVQDVIVGSDSSQIDNNVLSVKIVYSLPGEKFDNVFEIETSDTQTIGFY